MMILKKKFNIEYALGKWEQMWDKKWTITNNFCSIPMYAKVNKKSRIKDPLTIYFFF